MPPVAGIVGVLLAAGSATRFGSDKLMHPLQGGATIAVRSARNLLQALPGSIAVVRARESALARLLRAEGAVIVECPDAAEGMGRTLAAGVRASPDAAGWVVALSDMPFILPATIGLVAERLRAGDVLVAPCHRGERGHPVGFGAGLRESLESFRGDEGARALLRSRKDEVRLVEVNDPGVLRDIDTRDDLERDAGQG